MSNKSKDEPRDEQGKAGADAEQPKAPPPAQQPKAAPAPAPVKAGHVRCVALQSVIWNCESMPKGTVLELPQERFARLEKLGHVKRA